MMHRFVEGLLIISEMNENSSVPDDKSLVDLGSTSLQVLEIQEMLASQYGIHKNPDEIGALTYGQLKVLSAE